MASKLTTRHVLRIFREATPAQIVEGRDWYSSAWNTAVRLDPADPARAAGILAALSPRLSWSHNVERAERVYRDGVASGVLYSNGAKADRIFAGADPLDVLGGNKVRAFYASILGDPSAVCVDRHAHDVVVGRVCDDATRNKALSTPKRYAELADVYRRAAVQLSRERGETVTPTAVQATTWIVWRETYSSDHGRATREVTGAYFGTKVATRTLVAA